MKYRTLFVRIISGEYPESHTSLIRDIDRGFHHISRYTEFSKYSTNPLDKRLDLTAYFLATILTLEQNNIALEQIKAVCLQIATELTRPKNPLQRWLKRLPLKLFGKKPTTLFLKWMDTKTKQKVHKFGFRARVISEPQETLGLGYGIDILECGICKLFTLYHAQKFTPILCEVDRITSNLAGLELVRKGTIAQGAEKCDFRFKKVCNL